MRISTNFSKKEIEYVDEFPADDAAKRLKYKYNCPICLRFFNTILVSTCCQNYLCRLCIGEFAKKAKKDPTYLIKCPQCQKDDFRLNDVNLHATVKHYTDTPCKFNKKQNSAMKLTPMESNELFLPDIDKPTKASPFTNKELEIISPPVRRVRTANSVFDKENQTPNRQLKAMTEY